MKKIKKMKVLIMAVALLLTVNVMGVSAAEIQGYTQSETEEFVISEEETQLSQTNVDIVTMGNLQVGYVSINMLGGGRVAFGGTTCANFDISYVAVSITLEKYVDGKWTQVDNVFASFVNTSLAYADKTVNCTPGVSYRAHAWFITSHGGVYEQADIYTNAVTAY